MFLRVILTTMLLLIFSCKSESSSTSPSMPSRKTWNHVYDDGELVSYYKEAGTGQTMRCTRNSSGTFTCVPVD